MKDLETLNNMSQEELVEYILILQERPSNGPKRKDEVLVMIETEPCAIEDIAEALNITPKNVSSQLSYLRKDGYQIIGWTCKETKRQMRQIMG